MQDCSYYSQWSNWPECSKVHNAITLTMWLVCREYHDWLYETKFSDKNFEITKWSDEIGKTNVCSFVGVSHYRLNKTRWFILQTGISWNSSGKEKSQQQKFCYLKHRQLAISKQLLIPTCTCIFNIAVLFKQHWIRGGWLSIKIKFKVE